MDEKVRPQRCPFCGGHIRALYTLETTPTNGTRFEEFDWIACENGGVIGWGGQYINGVPWFGAIHPTGVKTVDPYKTSGG